MPKTSAMHRRWVDHILHDEISIRLTTGHDDIEATVKSRDIAGYRFLMRARHRARA